MNNRRIKKMIDLYLSYKMGVKEICKNFNISKRTFYKYLKANSFKTRSGYYQSIDTGFDELDYKLKQKYSGIIKRCQQKHYKGDYYKGLEYLSLDEWVKFCNKNINKLEKLWKEYIRNDKDRRLTVSIDRIDTDKGYVTKNIRFISYGHNCWLRNIRPIKIRYEDKNYYFMSAEEGSRFFDVRRQSIGDLLRGDYRKISSKYKVNKSSIDEVLSHSEVDNLKDYYREYIYER